MTAGTLTIDAEHLVRELAPRVLGVVIRKYHDFSAAEDAVQEALMAAHTQWPREGVPENPRAWLTQVALRKMGDRVRADSARRRRESAAISEPQADEAVDDSLILLFMCCHPALTLSSAIALTLRAVGGLTTAEIASAFLVPEATMAQRISRAKQTIRASGVPFEMPGPRESAARLSAVLHVLYLIFSEGYTSSEGNQLHRVELAREAIRLARALRELLPKEPEAAGLLALMLLTDARRAARTGPAGELIRLAEQDRSLWNREQIAEGAALLTGALQQGAIGSYQLQAAIAAAHDEASDAQATDWAQILTLYGLLKDLSDNPMVRLNHAIATAMVEGPAKGLALLDGLDQDQRIAGHHRLAAVRAHLLEMSGDSAGAIRGYEAAAHLTTNIPERNYLLTQAARLQNSR